MIEVEKIIEMGTDQLELMTSLQLGEDTLRGPDTWKA
jgi:hypothetical protein